MSRQTAEKHMTPSTSLFASSISRHRYGASQHMFAEEDASSTTRQEIIPRHAAIIPGSVSNHEEVAQGKASYAGSDFSRLPVSASKARNSTSAIDGPRDSPKTFSAVEHNRQRFSATIPRVDKSSLIEDHPGAKEQSASNVGVVSRYTDAMPGAEETAGVELATLLAQTQLGAAETSAVEDGQAVRLPDIVLAPNLTETDPIASALTYAPTITQSGTAAPFGETLPYTFTMSAIAVTPSAGTFNVTATVDNPITFQVNSGGNTDIPSDTAPAITQANYATVASDLTPNMGDLNGRPPRTRFWAEDLCIRHERFHCTDGIPHARSGVTLAQNWLNGQTAADVAGVNTLLGQVPARVIATRSAAMTYPGRENRAYGDGAPSYLARANAIKTKGDANGYAPPAGP